MWRWSSLGLGLLAAAIAIYLLACGEEIPPLPTPTAEPTLTPTPSATPTGPFHLLYREFGQEADTIWRVDPTNPQQREAIATIDHALGVGSFPVLSPQGDAIAYTVLPEGARDEQFQGQAFVMSIGGSPKEVADGVDATRLTAPVWSPNGRFLYLRRNTEETMSLIEVDIENGKERALFSVERSQAFALYPIALSGNGQTLYFATITGQGTFFGRYSLEKSELGPSLEATTAIGRDWALSPDGSRMAYLAPVLVGDQLLEQAFIADLATGAIVPLDSLALAGTTQLHPIWHPQGQSLTIGQLPSGKEASPALVIDLQTGEATALSPPEKGFDEPWSWSPDGQFLAVRSFDGTSLVDPGKMRLMIITSDGRRLLVAEAVEVMFVGWL